MSKKVKVFNTTNRTEVFEHGQVLLPREWGELNLATSMQFVGDSRFSFDYNSIKDVVAHRDQTGRLQSFTLASPWSVSDGYGRVGTLTLLELLKQGYGVRPVEIGWRNENDFTDDIRAAIFDSLLMTKWGVIHGVPTELSNVRTPFKALWTMWEGCTLPDGWRPLMDKYPGLPLIVPSHAQIEIFRRTGCKNPIYVVPDCVDNTRFTQVSRKAKYDSPFTVVSWAGMTERKCPIEMMEVFRRAFFGKKDVRLILKTHTGKFGRCPGIPDIDDDRITIVNELWTGAQLQQFLAGAHAGLFLSHGEGFFLEPLEACLTGLPCVVPTHSGCSDWANDRYFYPIRTAGEEKSPMMGPNQSWWVCDLDHAVEQLRAIYDDYRTALDRAAKGAYWISRNLTPANTANQLVKTLDRIDKEFG